MKKWNDFSRQERGMVIAIVVLIFLILLTNGRVRKGMKKGMDFFFSTETELPVDNKPGTN